MPQNRNELLDVSGEKKQIGSSNSHDSQLKTRNAQRGNVFLFILLGVVLFAALSFSIARGFRSDTTSTLSAREASLAASEMVSYAQKIERAVHKLRRQGCSETEINFDHPSFRTGHPYLRIFNENPLAPLDLSCNVFNANGAGLTPVTFPKDAKEPTEATSRFKNHYIPMAVHVHKIGTDFANGADNKRPTDLVLTAQFKNEDICLAINKLTNFAEEVPDVTGSLYRNTFSTEGRFQGSYTVSVAIRTKGIAIFNGKHTGCFYQGSPAISHQAFAKYIFYHVLIAR